MFRTSGPALQSFDHICRSIQWKSALEPTAALAESRHDFEGHTVLLRMTSDRAAAVTSDLVISPARPASTGLIGNADWLIEEAYDLPGSYHMERDESLARERAVTQNAVTGTQNAVTENQNGGSDKQTGISDRAALPNVLRLYSWKPAAVSLGFQQKWETVDLEAARRAGIDVVRRPTGGRAVLHANELTYAVIMRTPPEFGIYAAHNMIVQALMASLRELGPQFERLTVTGRANDENFREVYKPGTITNAACFASSARHEATFEGRKVIGSAQRRFGDVLLQHGSILLTRDHLMLPELLAISDEDRLRMHQHLERETATLSDVFGRDISPQEAAFSVRTHFVSHIWSKF